MARIIVGSYVVRFPLGGYLSWVTQWLRGFQQLGHEVWLVEKAGWPNACFDPARDVTSDDCAYGTRALAELLARHGLEQSWCFADHAGTYHGLSRARVETLFREADLLVDMGSHGAWLAEAERTRVRVLVDGEPGQTQMRMELARDHGEAPRVYDHYYTVGGCVGTGGCGVPLAGLGWRHVFDPVVVDEVELAPVPRDAPFTTIMSWQAHRPLEFRGVRYGQKDVEFAKFLALPARTSAKLEIAVAGAQVPRDELRRAGWSVRSAHQASLRHDDFWAYIRASAGEFAVCKNIFVATRSGWFGDREAAYLASGRPVVMQDTGFGDLLPTGEGLFAVREVDEAAAAIDRIRSDPERHSRAARAIAREHLDSRKVLSRFLEEVRR